MKYKSITITLLEMHLRSLNLCEGDDIDDIDYNYYKKFQHPEPNDNPSTKPWTIVDTSDFKRSYRKYIKDRRIQNSVEELMLFIQSRVTPPQLSNYPPDRNVHPLNSDGVFSKGTLSAHVKGQKIIMVFHPDFKKRVIYRYGLGTHQKYGQS